MWLWWWCYLFMEYYFEIPTNQKLMIKKCCKTFAIWWKFSEIFMFGIKCKFTVLCLKIANGTKKRHILMCIYKLKSSSIFRFFSVKFLQLLCSRDANIHPQLLCILPTAPLPLLRKYSIKIISNDDTIQWIFKVLMTLLNS